MAPRQKLSYVDDALSVGRRLRAAREQAGISQRALSFPGCTAAYISRIENGERIPSLQLLREFAARLNVGEQYLSYGRDELPVPRTTPTEARVAIRMGDFETARGLASAGLDGARSDTERAAAFSLLGEVALAEGEIDASRAALERASVLDPAIEERDPRAAESLGRMYARAFEYESAAAVFARNRDRRGCCGRSHQRGAIREFACERADRRGGTLAPPRRLWPGRSERARPSPTRSRWRGCSGRNRGCTATSRTPQMPPGTPSARSSCSRHRTSTTTSHAVTSC